MKKGAWVRPKHPKKPEPVSPTEALLPMLNWIGGRTPRSRSTSPTKNARPPQPLQQRHVSNDPILQSLQKAQAQQEARPVSQGSHQTRVSQPRSRHQEYAIEVDEDLESEYIEEIVPEPPVIRRVVAPQPRAVPAASTVRRPAARTSYERPAPRREPLVREREPMTRMSPWERLQEDRRRRRGSISSAWEDAITPLQFGRR
ncbi:uncharacterized protein KY384_003486 [Bacidia gigantensis]|uniref:uncharacterized protein n=1 Tax=Bacidia gigantensis TaxID=2732470 RepID=UPI001D052C8F|nr:uncharacterized protein KY384_003486 [Bacidia gigantensis]KAG8531850.1 hypothetical protein KY384_003486 [Bacidia gigantensis]